ncbi:MAG: M61 family peptidase [Bacteroidia bacterium]|nr:M61 family peptidase [Bacteroidia bacterium]
MTQYQLSFGKATQQIIDVSLTFEASSGPVELCLPHWRPGRYTEQPFAKNIADLRVSGAGGESLPWEKTTSHTWRIHNHSNQTITVNYSAFATQKDAGGTYLDDSLIYLNGITFLLYRKDRVEDPCTLSLDIPKDYLLGGGLSEKAMPYTCASYHELVDTPVLASPTLEHHLVPFVDVDIHLWIQGNHTLDIDKLTQDIRAYSQAQLALFGDCPVKEYHYLYLFWPHPYRHGVEHHNSTVIVMGPGLSMNSPEAYKSLLEISSHEFFHTWNVKALRPADMYPYDYGQHNYSRLHYVTEGVTTYYGDLMLWKSGVWDWDQWVLSINGELNRHFGMGGKDHISLEEASFDSWVNGYDTTGFPHRRISFYTKGYLVAMIADFMVRSSAGGAQNLDDVMYAMYQEIAKSGRGYTAVDYQTQLERASGISMDDFATAFLAGVDPLEPVLTQIAQAAGMKLLRVPPQNEAMARLGLDVSPLPDGTVKVVSIWPGSPLESLPIYPGDQILSINGQSLAHDFEHLLISADARKTVELTTVHLANIRSISVMPSQEPLAAVPQFISLIDATPEQLLFRQQWKKAGGHARLLADDIPSPSNSSR